MKTEEWQNLQTVMESWEIHLARRGKMRTEEWQNLQTLMETWEKRRERLGGFDANAEDILTLGRVLLAVIKYMVEESKIIESWPKDHTPE